MDEVVLITGSETLLGRKLIEKHLALGHRVVAPIAGKSTAKSETGTDRLSVLSWNRSSWFSAKTVAREARRLYGQLDKAYILHLSPPVSSFLDQVDPGELEEIMENYLKGNLALTRELLPLLALHEGTLGFAILHRTGGTKNALEAMTTGGFKGWSGALIKSSPLWACGFQSTSADTELYAKIILETMSKKPPKVRGRWLRFTGRPLPLRGHNIFDEKF